MKKKETFDVDPTPYARIFFDNLSEKDRRLYCGLEAIRIGYYGVSKVSMLYSVHKHTVRTGKKELMSGNLLPAGQIRKKGGGRKKKPIVH